MDEEITPWLFMCISEASSPEPASESEGAHKCHALPLSVVLVVGIPDGATSCCVLLIPATARHSDASVVAYSPTDPRPPQTSDATLAEVTEPRQALSEPLFVFTHDNSVFSLRPLSPSSFIRLSSQKSGSEISPRRV